MLTWSIGCIFLSLLPIILVEFGMSVAALSQIGLFSLIVFMVVASGILMRARYRISKEDGVFDQSRASLVMAQMPWRSPMSASFFAIITVALLARRGILPGPHHAWYAATIVFLLAHATAELGIFVVKATRRPNPE